MYGLTAFGVMAIGRSRRIAATSIWWDEVWA